MLEINVISLFFRDLMEVFPEAKVILSLRDPENWYRSVKDTIYKGNYERRKFPINIYGYFSGWTDQLHMNEKIFEANNRFNNGNSTSLTNSHTYQRFFLSKI